MYENYSNNFWNLCRTTFQHSSELWEELVKIWYAAIYDRKEIGRYNERIARLALQSLEEGKGDLKFDFLTVVGKGKRICLAVQMEYRKHYVAKGGMVEMPVILLEPNRFAPILYLAVRLRIFL